MAFLSSRGKTWTWKEYVGRSASRSTGAGEGMSPWYIDNVYTCSYVLEVSLLGYPRLQHGHERRQDFIPPAISTYPRFGTHPQDMLVGNRLCGCLGHRSRCSLRRLMHPAVNLSATDVILLSRYPSDMVFLISHESCY